MKKIKRLVALCLCATLTLGGVSIFQKEEKEVKAAQSWQLVWSDEFNGNALDTSVWSYETGNGNWGWGNGEIQNYRPENVKVSGGNLQIIAKRQNYGQQKYTSGRIITKGKKAFLYGKMEARIKVENGNQDGVWPAYWMMGNNMKDGVGWPNCGEIDIMEHANSRDHVGGCLHWNYEGINGNWDKHGSYGSGDAGKDYHFTDNVNNGINGWHTYGLIWDKDHMEWQVDGVTYFQQDITDNNAYCFQKEQFFLFNLALGGTGTGYTDYTTVNDATFKTTTMYVDYLRVYQMGEEGTGITVPTDKPDVTTKPTVTTKPQEVETETSIRYETVDAVADSKNVFDSYFGGNSGWGTATGNISNAKNTSVDIHMNSVGDNLWQVQASLKDLEYIAGNTYKYKCTITSNVTKSVRVKVVGDSDDYIFSQEDVTVMAGEPYNYEADITIPEDYAGRLDLYFGLGKNNYRNEEIDSNTAVDISISDMSFVTQKKIITVIEKPTVAPQTTKPQVVTTKKPTYKKPAKTKIVKITKKKKSLKIKLRKVKKADGYQIFYSRNKNFKKYKIKKTRYLNAKIKKLKSKKKYYIKARCYYINNNGERIYSRFTKTKKVKVK